MSSVNAGSVVGEATRLYGDTPRPSSARRSPSRPSGSSDLRRAEGLGPFAGILCVALVTLTTMQLTLGALSVLLLHIRRDGEVPPINELISSTLPRLPGLIGLALLSSIGIGIGFLLFIAPGLYLMVRWAVAVPAMMTGRLSASDALESSRGLTKDGVGATVLIVLFQIVMTVAISRSRAPSRVVPRRHRRTGARVRDRHGGTHPAAGPRARRAVPAPQRLRPGCGHRDRDPAGRRARGPRTPRVRADGPGSAAGGAGRPERDGSPGGGPRRRPRSVRAAVVPCAAVVSARRRIRRPRRIRRRLHRRRSRSTTRTSRAGRIGGQPRRVRPAATSRRRRLAHQAGRGTGAATKPPRRTRTPGPLRSTRTAEPSPHRRQPSPHAAPVPSAYAVPAPPTPHAASARPPAQAPARTPHQPPARRRRLGSSRRSARTASRRPDWAERTHPAGSPRAPAGSRCRRLRRLLRRERRRRKVRAVAGRADREWSGNVPLRFADELRPGSTSHVRYSIV